MKITSASCASIQAAKASLLTRLMVSTVSVMRKIGYQGALASLPLKDYKDIDAVFNNMYRTVKKI